MHACLRVCVCTCACARAQSCPTLYDPTDCSQPGSSVHGILQARILEWVAISYSKEFSQPRDGTRISYISCTDRQILYQLLPPGEIKTLLNILKYYTIHIIKSMRRYWYTMISRANPIPHKAQKQTPTQAGKFSIWQKKHEISVKKIGFLMTLENKEAFGKIKSYPCAILQTRINS